MHKRVLTFSSVFLALLFYAPLLSSTINAKEVPTYVNVSNSINISPSSTGRILGITDCNKSKKISGTVAYAGQVPQQATIDIIFEYGVERVVFETVEADSAGKWQADVCTGFYVAEVSKINNQDQSQKTSVSINATESDIIENISINVKAASLPIEFFLLIGISVLLLVLNFKFFRKLKTKSSKA